MRVNVYLSEQEIDRIKNGEGIKINATYPLCPFYLRKENTDDAALNETRKPKIITICGSYRFSELMLTEYKRLTELGYIVLMPAIGCEARSKEWYLNLHYEKISVSDAIYVIDKGGYIGESTQLEIDKAKELGKTVYRWSRNDI